MLKEGQEGLLMRMVLETWFDAQGIRPRVIGEFEDSALMEVCSSGGRGFTVVHTVIDRAALKHYGLRVIAKGKECGSDFFAITGERRVKHPAPVAITEHRLHSSFRKRVAGSMEELAMAF